MKFLKRAGRVQAELKPASFGAIFVTPDGHHTKIADSHFEISLPGLWTQDQRDQRTVFNESGGTKQLFLTKYEIAGKVRMGGLRNLVFEQITRKQQTVLQYSKWAASFSHADARKVDGQDEFLFHGFDPSNQVASLTVFRATPQVVIDFSLYQFGVAEFDPELRKIYVPVFGSIKMK